MNLVQNPANGPVSKAMSALNKHLIRIKVTVALVDLNDLHQIISLGMLSK